MKYGESVFDVVYLLIAIVGGVLILRKSKAPWEKKMGLAVLILGLGDAFHLVPRVLHYFIAADLTAALGVGKLVTSVTMTVFYVFMYHICVEYGGAKEDKRLTGLVYLLAAIRVVLCLLPQNRWVQNDSSALWGALRNIPFVILGGIVMVGYYRNRNGAPGLKRVWLYILLSFLFYIPVAVFAGLLPILGMLMLPKTVCYIALIVVFYRIVYRDPGMNEGR